jgi:hypothetical protein
MAVYKSNFHLYNFENNTLRVMIIITVIIRALVYLKINYQAERFCSAIPNTVITFEMRRAYLRFTSTS